VNHGALRSAWVFAVALALCARYGAAAYATPPDVRIPFTRTPAVSARVLLGLISATADSDIVSPAGINAVLCALEPVMSARARRQRRDASESECGRQPAYVARSIWFDREVPVDARAEPLLRRQAELYFEPSFVNAGVARWLKERGALGVPLRRPLVFAAVSAVDYAGGWEYPFYTIQPEPYVFHGKKRDTRVGFLAGRQLASIGDRSCVRGVMPIHGGGAVFVTEIGSRPVSAAIGCLSKELDPKSLVNAHFFIPKLSLRHTVSIRERLQGLGLTDIFDAHADPFPKLFRGRKIDDAIQAAELTTDWKGIRVRATTVVDVVLGGPRFGAVLAYDHPFALRVIDDRGVTVAVAIVNDLNPA
jgi:hypothetical protein